jgi:hypothetical protein
VENNGGFRRKGLSVINFLITLIVTTMVFKWIEADFAVVDRGFGQSSR